MDQIYEGFLKLKSGHLSTIISSASDNKKFFLNVTPS